MERMWGKTDSKMEDYDHVAVVIHTEMGQIWNGTRNRHQDRAEHRALGGIHTDRESQIEHEYKGVIPQGSDL